MSARSDDEGDAPLEPRARRPRLIARPVPATFGPLPLLDDMLSAAQQARLAHAATLLDYRALGAAIYSEGEDAHFLYLIDSGVVRLAQHLSDGRRPVLAFMWPGDLLGLAENGRYVNAADSLTPARIFRFPLQTLHQLLLEEPQLQLQLLTKVAHDLRTAQRQIIVLGQMETTRRLGSFLLDCRQHPSVYETEGHLLRLPMSRFDIADYLGTSPESIARAFGRLEKEGFIRRISPRVIELVANDRLARLVRGGPSGR